MASKKRFTQNTPDINSFLSTPASTYNDRQERREALISKTQQDMPAVSSQPKMRANATVRTTRPCKLSAYVSEEIKQQAVLVKAKTGIGLQDVSYALLKWFFEKHYDEASGLTPEGEEFIRKNL